ncbi:DUF4184 family protein [Providencia huaxiensis]|uniref:DUF4184 family protein n=1 Tax=Providencia TaxID=586 RepID=UPI00234B7E00|nr:DUF4184 family protein [Providencia sp. PROV076]
MPWTFSHPAVVFPIKQSRFGRFLSLPALILGSLSPDLFYSMMWYSAATMAHDLIGWLYTGLPLCLLITIFVQKSAFFLHYAVPFPLKSRSVSSLRQFCIVVLSFYIGAASHIIWDAFTHQSGAFVRHAEFLQLVVFNMTDSQEIAIYKLLQHLGSLLGALYLLIKYKQFYRRQSAVQQQQYAKKLMVLLKIVIISACVSLPFAYNLAMKGDALSFNRFVYLELTLLVPVFFTASILFALIKYQRQRKAMQS